MAQKKWKSGTPGVYKLEDKPNGKCRLWRLMVSVTKEKNGKKEESQVTENFEGTYKAAVERRHEMKAEATSKDAVIPSTITFDDYSEKFLQARRENPEIAPGTVKREKDKLNAIALHIGSMQMQAITKDDIDKAIDKLRKGKSRSGRRLSGTYLNDIVKKTSLLMDAAVEAKIIEANPCDEVKRPKTDTKPKRALVASVVNKLIGKLNPAEPLQLGVILCITLGLRRCEAVGLSWEDVNFEERTVHVLHDYDDEGNLTESKTEASERYLPMSQFVFDALTKRLAIAKVLYEQYAPDCLYMPKGATEKEIKGSIPVLSDRHGNRYHPASLGQWWYKHRALYGLDDWKLHELRHTFLTLAAKKSVHPSVMQKLAGHSTARITMEIYTHVNMDDKQAAMETIGEVFEPSDEADEGQAASSDETDPATAA